MRPRTSRTCSAVAYEGLWTGKTHQKALATSLRASGLRGYNSKQDKACSYRLWGVEGGPEAGWMMGTMKADLGLSWCWVERKLCLAYCYGRRDHEACLFLGDTCSPQQTER